ncbi:MAG TPA: CAP domain-containing protein [Bacteroidales bacterium]|nr:CAP domain-containing protein [Bacteroidales bacterium]
MIKEINLTIKNAIMAGTVVMKIFKAKRMFSLMLVISWWITGSTQTKPAGEYYTRLTHADFRNEPEFSKSLNFGNIDFDRLQAILFFLTNEVRVKNRLKPLEYSEKLEQTAKMHANDMVAKDFFSHLNTSDNRKKTPNDRARLSGISNPFLAENIIEGYGLRYTANETVYTPGRGKFSETPDGELLQTHTYLSFGETLIKNWMNSKDHRKNILAPEALQLGCAVAYFVDSGFNDMPSFKAVQNFQWYQPVK